jgi:Na+-driven multidrug efflux pump
VHRAFLIVFIPAAIVGVFYLLIFRGLGFEVEPAPFLGTAAAFLAGLFGVWRYQRRKHRGHRS